MIDADPNHPIQTWAAGGNAPPGMHVVSDVDEGTIIERIDEAASKTLWSAKKTFSGSTSFTRRFFPARIRDGGHRESTSLQLGNPLECSVVGLVAPAPLSANSDRVFLVQDWSVGGRDCNVAPNISVFVECVPG